MSEKIKQISTMHLLHLIERTIEEENNVLGEKVGIFTKTITELTTKVIMTIVIIHICNPIWSRGLIEFFVLFLGLFYGFLKVNKKIINQLDNVVGKPLMEYATKMDVYMKYTELDYLDEPVHYKLINKVKELKRPSDGFRINNPNKIIYGDKFKWLVYFLIIVIGFLFFYYSSEKFDLFKILFPAMFVFYGIGLWNSIVEYQYTRIF